MARRSRSRSATPQVFEIKQAIVESLDQEGRGVAHVDGKTIFIDGALPQEKVTFQSHLAKASYEVANVVDVLKQSNQRVTPKCPHFGNCGGCKLQHLDFAAQVAAKQRLLENDLWHIGKVKAKNMLPPLFGPTWGYRHRARLTVRNVLKKGTVLVGFHEKRSSYVADMTACEVLPKRMSRLLPLLRELGGAPMATFVTEHSKNSYPRLAIRENETVLLTLTRFASADDHAGGKSFVGPAQVMLRP